MSRYIVFARTRYQYQSYTDFWRLVELSGFRTCWVDDIDLASDCIYITTPVNGELRPHITHRRSILKGPQRSTTIWWNLERPDSGQWPPEGRNASNMTAEIRQYVDRVWVSDRYYQSFDPEMVHVVFGSHPGLRDSWHAVKCYDWCHMSYEVGRRCEIYNRLRGLGLKEGPNGWGAERAKTLAGSKILVNVHQTPEPIGEPLRIALAAAYSLPILSEVIRDPWPLMRGRDYIESDLSRLCGTVQAVIGNGDSFCGANLHDLLCRDWTFERGVYDGLLRSRIVL